jgi:hypothetical protein
MVDRQSAPEVGRAALIAAVCLVVTVAYGALYYGFAVLITDDAAGADFSRVFSRRPTAAPS